MTELDVEPRESKKPALAWHPAQNAEFKSQSECSRTRLTLRPSISPPSFCSHTTGLEWANISSFCLLVLSLTSGSTLGVLRFYLLPLLSRKTLQTKSKDAQIPILREGVIDRKVTQLFILVILSHSPMLIAHPFLYSVPTSSGFPCPLIPHIKSFSYF